MSTSPHAATFPQSPTASGQDRSAFAELARKRRTHGCGREPEKGSALAGYAVKTSAQVQQARGTLSLSLTAGRVSLYVSSQMQDNQQ